jgi:lipopolysaccharide transport system ATP-binding protein
MSDHCAIRFSNVGKMFRLYPTRLDSVLDALGVARWLRWRRGRPRELWALRHIDLTLPAGSRLGIIGRNGAGKTTLLRLITGNLTPTEGDIEVTGRVQALLEVGAGFHPEFTGYENIRASLTLQGLDDSEIEAALTDIIEFTELEPFLAQPFKTYSAGMQARLAFATATVLRPDILIVDEILGAGDAYFAGKSSERMKQLVERSGASVLLVSHAMEQIIRYCDQCIWIERGRIVMRGPSMQVVNAYEGFIHALEDRRLRAKNQKRRLGGGDQGSSDPFDDAIILRFEVTGEVGASLDVSEISLLRNGRVEELLRVGDVQDASVEHASSLIVQSGDWSEPQGTSSEPYRGLAATGTTRPVTGRAAFHTHLYPGPDEFALRLRSRCRGSAAPLLSVSRHGTVVQISEIGRTPHGEWTDVTIPVHFASSPMDALRAPEHRSGARDPSGSPTGEPAGLGGVVRWPSDGTLLISHVTLLDAEGRERAVFVRRTPLTVAMSISACRSGHFEVVAGVTVFRLDGVFVSNLISPAMPMDLVAGQRKTVKVSLTEVNLGDGGFVLSLSIFEGVVTEATRYDLVARAYEFQVVGNPPLLASAIFEHPATWVVADDDVGAPARPDLHPVRDESADLQ